MRPLSLALLLLLPAALAAAPQLQPLNGQALQTGATTVLTLTGGDLMPEPRLLLAVPIAKQELQPGASANQVRIAVTLAADVPPGIYSLRIATPRGISNAVPVALDDLAPQPADKPLPRLPAAVTGSIAGSDTARVTFAGKQGQRLIAEIDARRLGSALDPALELFTADRRQIAWAMSSPLMGGDARLEAELPADGSYTVDVHDVLYQGAAPGFFRLKLGELRSADLALPLGVRRKVGGTVELIGNLPGPVRVPVSADVAAVIVPAPLPKLTGLTGPAPALAAGDDPEVLQAPQPAGKLQEVPTPAAISGRLTAAGSEDRYKLLVQPGQRLRFDVQARRLGSPLDGVLTVYNEAGGGLASNDDRPDTIDPGLDFTVPADVKALVVGVRDQQGRGGPTFVYRVSVTPLGRPNFNLTVFEGRALVPQGGAALLRVRAERNGFAGPIKLSIPNLPAGVTLSGADVPPGSSEALLALVAPANQAPAQLITRLVGTATDAAGVEYSRTALLPASPTTQQTPWLRAELGLAVTPTEPFAVAWEKEVPGLTVGTVVNLPLRLTRAAGAAGAVRLALVTSQVVPKKQDGKEDTDRALRLEGTPTVPAGQATFPVPVRVPGDLPPNLPYDLAVRAELLSPDGNTVVASAVSPSLRLSVTRPLSVKLTSPPAVEARAGAGPTAVLAGTIDRGPVKEPLTVTLLGLPPTLPVPAVLLAGDQAVFSLPVAFPFGTPIGELKNVRLVARAEGASSAQSNEVPLTVTVVRGAAPPPAGPLVKLFDDEPGLLPLLTDGNAVARLDLAERYSGPTALRVSGVQRYRAAVPGWGFKVAEKPGPGEFRYLRFAWKKKGGNNVLLQLAANGQFGPTRGQSGPAFRYEAGPRPNAFNAAAVQVEGKLPGDWVVVTRDLFADFGAFTLTGIAFTPGAGEAGWFDHVYLARSADDFKGCPAPVKPGK